VIARVNHPKNQWLFTEAWGVDVSVSTSQLISALAAEAVPVGSQVGAAAARGRRRPSGGGSAGRRDEVLLLMTDDSEQAVRQLMVGPPSPGGGGRPARP
jgi:hypothetical protein